MAGVYYDNWNSLVPRSLMRDDRASHYHIAAFAVLGDYVSDKNGSKVWPSQTTIAERMKDHRPETSRRSEGSGKMGLAQDRQAGRCGG
jgi:hypothetical protein